MDTVQSEDWELLYSQDYVKLMQLGSSTQLIYSLIEVVILDPQSTAM